jgi:hypothetical protein
MEKNYFVSLLVFFCGFVLNFNHLLAQELIDEIKIDPTRTNELNLSGPLNDSISFHLLINQVTSSENYESIIYFYNDSRRITELKLFEGSEKPNYVTFHVSEEILTLIGQNERGIVVNDVDFKTGNVQTKEFNMKLKNVFSLQNTTVMIGEKINESSFFAIVKNTQDIQRMLVNPKSKEDKKFLKECEEESIEFVNDKQYIDVGPIKAFKGYLYKDKIYILNENVKTNLLKIYSIDRSGVLELNYLQGSKYSEAHQLNTFLKDNLLFVFSLQDHISNLNIYNFDTNELIKTITYPKDQYGPVNSLIFDGKEVTTAFEASKFHKNFMPKVGSIYNPRAYIAVNKTTDGDYQLKIGHVDANTYKGNTSHNFWWKFPVFELNHNFTSGTSKGLFNPYSAAYGLFYNAMAAEKRKGSSFAVQLDSQLNLSEKSSVTEYQPFDPDTYKEKLKQTMDLKNYFFIPQGKLVKLINLENDKQVYRLYKMKTL